MHGKEFKEFYQEIGFKMVTEVRRRVWFLMKILMQIELSTVGFTEVQFLHNIVSYSVCFAIFGYLLQRKCWYVYGATRFSTSFLSWMLHGRGGAWLCLFFSKKNAIFGVQKVYKKRHEIVWNMMMMHGYAYFSKRNAILSVEFKYYTRKNMK